MTWRDRLALAALSAAVLFPVAATGSFGGKPCGADFACHFEAWGLLLGAVGIPNSGFLFIVLHLWFRHPARSKVRQFFLGGFMGVAAFEVSAVCAALLGARAMNPLAGFVPVYVALAIASVLYARSEPRAPGGPG